MHLDFEDHLEAELPFLRTNPRKAELVEVIELDGMGNVLDVVTTNPCNLGALEDDYHLEPIIDETTDNMPFEMSELLSAEEGDYLDDAEELGVTFGGKVSGSIGTRGITGSASSTGQRFSISKLAALARAKAAATAKKRRSAKKPSRAQLQAKARAKFKLRRQAKIDAAKKKEIKKRKAAPKPSWKGVKFAPGLKVYQAKKSLPRQVFEEIHAEKKLPQVVAKPKLATAGVTCGCAQIGRIEGMLKKAAVQRVATSEHKTLINQKKFRTRTIGQLRAILGRLSTKDRSRVIRAACGMGGG